MIVSGLSGGELAALRTAQLTDDKWQGLLRVSVTGNDAAPVAGRYVITDRALQFQPRFPFDPGRSYSVRFDPGRLPSPRSGRVVEQVVALPAPVLGPSTVVAAIHPSADVWPENVLRFYVHFSAPMSASSAASFVRLVDEAGREVRDAFLVLEADLWNDDYTRCTVFFDPGRVKRGVRPNVELGRAIREGRRYAIVVDAAWPDARGQPLKAPFRHEFRGGPPVERALSVGDWHLSPPNAGSRAPLVVTFPWPLDRGLLMRAVGVAASDGRVPAGDVTVDPGETRWRFAPRDPWPGGEYQLVVLTLLEDAAGNKVGRAFEVERFVREDRAPPPEKVTVPFSVR